MRSKSLSLLTAFLLLVAAGICCAQENPAGDSDAAKARRGLMTLAGRLHAFTETMPENKRLGPGRLAQAKLALRKAAMLMARRRGDAA